MAVRDPFIGVRQSFYLPQALDEKTAKWQKVAFIALAFAAASGHANVARIESELGTTIGPALGITDFSASLKVAIEKGWLAPTSSTKCLVLSPALHHPGTGVGSTICTVCPIEAARTSRRRETARRANAESIAKARQARAERTQSPALNDVGVTQSPALNDSELSSESKPSDLHKRVAPIEYLSEKLSSNDFPGSPCSAAYDEDDIDIAQHVDGDLPPGAVPCPSDNGIDF